MFMCHACVKKPVLLRTALAKITVIKGTDLETELNCAIFNHNKIRSTLLSSRIHIYYKEMLLGSGNLAKETKLPTCDTTIVPFICHANLQRLSKVLPEVLSTDSADFSIEGNNTIKCAGFKLSVPIKDNVKIHVKNAINEQIAAIYHQQENLKIKEITFERMNSINKSSYQMKAEIKNAFPFDYELARLIFTLYRRNGTDTIAHCRMLGAVTQQAGTKSEISFHVSVNNSNALLATGLSDSLRPKLEFILKGEAEIIIRGYVFSIPLEEVSSASFNLGSGIIF